jgi:hypothetical protein
MEEQTVNFTIEIKEPFTIHKCIGVGVGGSNANHNGKKFEEDKERVAIMKENRKFKPF